MENIVDKVSEAELEILKVLWDNGNPMTDRQIREALGEENDWKHSTTQTLIKRLVDKSALRREKKVIFYYTPAITKQEFENARTKDFVNKVFGGSAKGLLSALLNNDVLSEDEMSDLKDFWKARIEQDE
jgi:BlaI family penicillinase repressor